MPPGPSVRVLLSDAARAVSRSSIDWIVERQRHARVLVPPSLQRAGILPARALHEPFAAPEPEAAVTAGALAALLVPQEGATRQAAEAAALALLAQGAVIVIDRETFRDLIPLSCWSMNLPERPTDGLLVQHLGIAGRLPEAWRDAAEEGLEAVLSGNTERLARATRARRLRARRDGPERFGRLAKRSAGLRPGVVYLDLLSPEAAAAPEFADLLRRLDRTRALSLASVAAAMFI